MDERRGGGESAAERTGREIAVIGMAGRFPGARDLEEFWKNLREGREAISALSDEELSAAGVPEALLAHPDYVKAASLLDGADLFDAPFFGYTAHEAEIMDPQQRLFLEHAWEALEDAGYAPGGYDGLIGVYAGVGWNTYLLSNLREHPELFEGGGGFQVFITNDKDFMPTRVSYKLDLKGPSVVVQTSCSTSLVAVHLACLSLLSFECDTALAGGVTVKVPQRAGYLYQEGGLASPDGHCRAFDARAAGTVFGSGVGVVVLKRLDEALAAGDPVRAVIRGSAINNDGRAKVSFTAPSADGQAEVIAAALAVAEVAPETVRYVETHGTGTSLGDPIEVSALTKIFADAGGAGGSCALGSVKTNVGHLDAAAGIVGFIKTVLALQHRELPPSLHFETPNPAIDFEAGPFYVNTALADWPSGPGPRRAGVSSFGVGGTNAHVVLEEAPAPEPSGPARPWQLLVLSARSRPALEEAAHRLRRRLERDEAIDGPALADVAYTLAMGREVFRHRLALVCHDRRDALEALASPGDEARGRLLTATDDDEPRDRPVAFLLPGAGSEHLGVARELHRHEPVFRRELDRALERLEPELRELLLDREPGDPEAAGRLAEPRLGLPALFAVEHALARLWAEWGVRPLALLGCGVGEYVAAVVAGVFTLEEALGLLAPPGRSAGPPRLALRPPRIPVLSAATGGWLTAEEATDPGRWRREPPEAAHLDRALEELLGEADRVLLEVGPGQVLSTGAHRHPVDGERLVVPSLAAAGDGTPAQADLRGALGRLWLAGVRIDWQGFYQGERRRRIALPPYPFERRRYWIEGRGAAADRSRRSGTGPVEKRADVADWFYLPAWRPESPLPAPGTEHGSGSRPGPVLVLMPPAAPDASVPPPGRRLAELVVRELRERGRGVVTAEPGERFRRLAEDRYRVPPASEEGFAELVAALGGAPPAEVVHAWCLDPLTAPAGSPGELEPALETGFYSLLFLARALVELGAVSASGERGGAGLTVLADRMEAITPAEPLVPERAAMLGLVRVLPQEHPELAARAFDVQLPAASGASAERSLRHLAATLVSSLLGGRDGAAGLRRAAFRGRRLWVPDFEPVRAEAAAEGEVPLRRRGVYLLTGGLEGNGLALARLLARDWGARLVLLEGPTGPNADAAARVALLEGLGAEVAVLRADLADPAAVARAVAQAEERFGAIHGVVHAAGTRGERTFRVLAEAGREECGWHFAAKVLPLLALDRALAGRDLDFAVAVSSLASVLGGLAYGPYTAANLYLDAFARERSRRGGLPWRSLDWDVWRFEDEREQITEVRSDLAELAMSPEEGEEAFRRALALAGADQVLVSTADLPARLGQAEERVRARLGAGGSGASPGTLHPRPELDTPYAPPESELECRIAAVWGAALGFREVGLDDNFFDLGGDSFLAVQVVSRLREELRVDLPTAQLYQRMTVRALARFLGESAGEAAGRRATQLEERRASSSRRREVIEHRRLRRAN